MLTVPTSLPSLFSEKPPLCPICGAAHPTLIGQKDFGVSCNDYFIRARTYPDYGLPIPYFQCSACAFIFTNSFDNWSDIDFKTHLYNDEYLLSDPPFAHDRPQANAAMLAQMFLRDTAQLEILDYGGGMGLTAKALRDRGFKADAYDPFFSTEAAPMGQYSLVLAFEVIEHVLPSEQLQWMRSLRAFLTAGRSSKILLSTDLAPNNTLDRWYIAPRNGHISIHTAASLARLSSDAGLHLTSLSSSLHLLTIKS